MMFSEQRWERVPEEAERIIALLGIEPGASVLDLCCGPGRHSLELARRGFRVTGVDRTASYLEQARTKAHEEGLDIEFVQEDMRAFCRPDAFEGTINVFTSFGYFEDPAEDRKVLANLYRSLKPGGCVLLDTIGKEVLARIYQARDWQERDGILLLQERNVQSNWGWMEIRWIMIEGTERKEFTLGHRLFSATELMALFKEAGFTSVDAYGNLEGAPYDQTARRLIVVARKG
jgi:ubiquinone/menaquinone biosynthesis C-methylase UbiE